MEADFSLEPDWINANTLGKTNSVANVAAIKPPITARPSGAFCCPASPKANAIGNMPAIIAKLVIKIDRKRLPAPCTAASLALCISSRRFSAKVTNRIALAIATPMAMIEPMKD